MIIFVSDMFVEDYVGGAELTSEAVIQDSLVPVTKIHSNNLTPSLMGKNKDKFWIFGNFSNLSRPCIVYAIKNLTYSVLEYDYKFCKYRSAEKHYAAEKQNCACHNEQIGKLISIFFKKSITTWFMSEKQKQIYLDKFPFLNNESTKVLSSVLPQDILEYIDALDCSKKDEKWLILNSDSWIKGRDLAVNFAKSKDLEYELVWGLEHKEVLKKMSTSKGIIYLPPGGDTCPRFIIEAKLLGCELMLNDNVQHKDESWFQDKKTAFSYLKERTEIFWSTTEDKWNLDTPKFKTLTEDTKFNIIVPFYNAEEWLKKCIISIKRQKYNNFRCFLIDDLSTDLSSQVVLNNIKNDDRFKLVKNTEKKYALGNIVETLLAVAEDEEVNVLLDGDDWLASKNVLSHLNQEYSQSECLLTYGSYVYHPDGFRGIEPSMYPESVIEDNLFRKDSWRASHLRTFKTKLWKEINLDDLKNSQGYYKTAYDQALMLPLLELSGGKFKFVSHIMHTYNRENPLNVDKIKQKTQFERAQQIRKKKPYKSKF